MSGKNPPETLKLRTDVTGRDRPPPRGVGAWKRFGLSGVRLSRGCAGEVSQRAFDRAVGVALGVCFAPRLDPHDETSKHESRVASDFQQVAGKRPVGTGRTGVSELAGCGPFVVGTGGPSAGR